MKRAVAIVSLIVALSGCSSEDPESTPESTQESSTSTSGSASTGFDGIVKIEGERGLYVRHVTTLYMLNRRGLMQSLSGSQPARSWPAATGGLSWVGGVHRSRFGLVLIDDPESERAKALAFWSGVQTGEHFERDARTGVTRPAG